MLQTQIYSLFLLLICMACNGQDIAPKSGSGKSKITFAERPIVKKNYFIKEYPQEFFSVQCGLEDKTGNMWFGTAGNGIYYYDGKSFTNFTHKDGLCHDDILCCMEDKAGNIWFGTRNGVIKYTLSTGKPEKKKFASLLISANTISNTTHARVPYSYRIADNFVWSIFQDKTGKIWFGTNKGIYIHDPLAYPDADTPLFTHFLDDERILNKNNLLLKGITSFAEDARGNIWFSSGYIEGEGICRYDGKSVINFKPDGITSFRTIIAGKNDDLFFLNAFKGVYRYDGRELPAGEDGFTNFTREIGITNDTIIAIKEDRAGNFWFGRNSDNMQNGGDGGVWRYDGRSLKLLTTKDGLSHNCVFCIVEDRKGNMWFGTRNTGLCRYDGKRFEDFTDK